MKLDIKLVIVPNWLEAVMAANSLEKEALVDLVALSRIMSENDICFYVAINSNMIEKIGPAIGETLQCHSLATDNGSLTVTRQDGSRPSPEEVKALNEKLNSKMYGFTRTNLELLYPTASSLVSVMPYRGITDDKDGASDEMFLFELFEIRERMLGIRFTRPDTAVSYEQQLWACYDRALELLHLYVSEHDVAKTAMFKEYVKLCRVVPLNM